jgi:hypothetical protein
MVRLFLVIRRGQIEVNSTEGALVFSLTEYDRDLFVEGDPMAQVGTAIFVSLDRLLDQGNQRCFTLLRRLIQAENEFLIGFQGLGGFWFEQVRRHEWSVGVNRGMSKIKNSTERDAEDLRTAFAG